MGAYHEEFEKMVRIRLRRMGLKKQPGYRIVVADQRSARTGGSTWGGSGGSSGGHK